MSFIAGVVLLGKLDNFKNAKQFHMESHAILIMYSCTILYINTHRKNT